jgi:hypothetical protein
MTGRKDIEARLDRSLENQIKAPRLDRRFDGAVWSKIEAAEARATNPRTLPVQSHAIRASRWLAISNIVGVAVTLGMAIYIGIGALGGIDVRPEFNVPVPKIPEAAVTEVTLILGYVLGGCALVLGLSLTSFGRRIRASFS